MGIDNKQPNKKVKKVLTTTTKRGIIKEKISKGTQWELTTIEIFKNLKKSS